MHIPSGYLVTLLLAHCSKLTTASPAPMGVPPAAGYPSQGYYPMQTQDTPIRRASVTGTAAGALSTGLSTTGSCGLWPALATTFRLTDEEDGLGVNLRGWWYPRRRQYCVEIMSALPPFAREPPKKDDGFTYPDVVKYPVEATGYRAFSVQVIARPEEEHRIIFYGSGFRGGEQISQARAVLDAFGPQASNNTTEVRSVGVSELSTFSGFNTTLMA